MAMFVVMLASIAGNFAAPPGWPGASATAGDRADGLGYLLAMVGTYAVRGRPPALMVLLPSSACSRPVRPFTMYLPALPDPVLRTTGAGSAKHRPDRRGGRHRRLRPLLDRRRLPHALFAAGCLFLPAGLLALLLPELSG